MLSSLSNNQRGIAAICGCMASYTVNDVLVKQILQTYPVGEVIFVRGVMCSLLIGAVALAFGHASAVARADEPDAGRRARCATACPPRGFIAALAHMKLANIAAVLQIAPLIITALSVVLYREAVGWRRWTRDRRGLLSARCSSSSRSLPNSTSGRSSRAASALLLPRSAKSRLARSDRQCRSSWSRSGGRSRITLCGAVFVVAEDWRMFTGAEFFQLFVAAVFVGIAIYLLALGFRDVDLSVVAPFRYSYLLTSALGGFWCSGRCPMAGPWSARPDRGQRHLYAASRSGAPPLAHRHGGAAPDGS